MKRGRVLVTGGAGFIGSHLVDRLLALGHPVRVLDALLPQVHPHGRPDDLDPEAELRVGDVRDPDSVRSALDGVDDVVHLAAAVGVGQSMYEIVHYSAVNVMGTATLLEAIVKQRLAPHRLVVASSMSIYGEGQYRCDGCGPQAPGPRPASQLDRRDWAMRCPQCGSAMAPCPTPESKPLLPTSVYAINKRDQEEMVLTVARSLGLAAVALRFFNVYGDRQALSNPYTGVAAIFSSALLNGRRPLVFEDGLQARDFTHVSDIVEGLVRALESDRARDAAINLGTGRPTNLLELSDLLRRELPGASGIEPEVVGRFREGDIRTCYADLTLARELLGYEPRVDLADGVRTLAAWVAGQQSLDKSAEALGELRQHGLVR
jgi:dTDP-L-rhamnose 4-epimerase